jgi:hypothetical protein
MSGSTNRSLPAGPEVWFRIVHSAVPRRIHAPSATYREQEVAVAFGPIGSFEDCDIGTLRRRIDADHAVRVVPLTQGNLKPPKVPKTPHVTELLRKAMAWRREIDTGEVRNQADISRREGITRARVTQIMGLLRLSPEIREKILALPPSLHCHPMTERMLRPIGAFAVQNDQMRKFQRISLQAHHYLCRRGGSNPHGFPHNPHLSSPP